MTPNDYAKDIVVPTVKEFVEEPLNVRRMYLACVTTYHLCDYLDPKEPQKIQERVAVHCGQDMQVVYEICIGAKHARPRKRQQFKAGDEVMLDPGFPYRFPIFFGGCLCVPHNGRMEPVYHCIRGALSAFKKEFSSELRDFDISFLV